MSNFINNQVEKRTGFDMNGDGYVGGEGMEGKLERATHVDFNGDGFIGRLPDTIPGGGFPPMNPNSGFGGFPPGGYGGPGPY